MLLLSSGAISIFKFSSVVKCSVLSGKRLIFDESSTLKVALAPHFGHDSSTLVEAESLGLEFLPKYFFSSLTFSAKKILSYILTWLSYLAA